MKKPKLTKTEIAKPNNTPKKYLGLKIQLDGQQIYKGNMDKECINLCNAMNSIPGIITHGSCCGHGKEPFRIYFNVTSFMGLFFLTRCCDIRYWKYGRKWQITLLVGDQIINDILPTHFILSSADVGKKAYKQAENLVENMNVHLNIPNFIKTFKIDLKEFVTNKTLK